MSHSGLPLKPVASVSHSNQNPAFFDVSAAQNTRRASSDSNLAGPPRKRQNTGQNSSASDQRAQTACEPPPRMALSVILNTDSELPQARSVTPENQVEMPATVHSNKNLHQIERTPELTGLWTKFIRFAKAVGSNENAKYACPQFIHAANLWASKNANLKADLETALDTALQRFKAVFPQATASANAASNLRDTNTLEFDHEQLLAHLFLTASNEININHFSQKPAEDFVASVALGMVGNYYSMPESKKKRPHKNKGQATEEVARDMSDEAVKKARQGVKIICAEYLTSITELPLESIATHPSIKTLSAREKSVAKLQAENETTPFTSKFFKILKDHASKGDNYTRYSFKTSINNATTSKPNLLNVVINSFTQVHEAPAAQRADVIKEQSSNIAKAFKKIRGSQTNSIRYGSVTVHKARKVMSNPALVQSVAEQQTELREAVQLQLSRTPGAADQTAAATLRIPSGEHRDTFHPHLA
jgi:hypothetical protein